MHANYCPAHAHFTLAQVVQYYNENGGKVGRDFAFDPDAGVVPPRQFIGRS